MNLNSFQKFVQLWENTRDKTLDERNDALDGDNFQTKDEAMKFMAQNSIKYRSKIGEKDANFRAVHQPSYIENVVRPMSMTEYRGLDKSEFWKKSGARTQDEMDEHERKRSVMMQLHVDVGLASAKLFEIDKAEKRLLLLTDAPTDKRILKTLKSPFPSMFFDVEISKEEAPGATFEKLHGILLMRVKTKRSGPNGEDEAPSLTEGYDSYYYLAYSASSHFETGEYSYVEDCIFAIDETKVVYSEKSNVDFLRNFVTNILMFLNHPEVELVERQRSNKGNERRVRNGQIPLPSSQFVKLKGRIKRYVDNFGTSIMGDGFDYRFWVRGHWRVHRSEKYTQMRGKILWIEPFLKGKGEVVNKTYQIEADEKDIEEYKDSFLFMDDIVPLDKPLAKMDQDERARMKRQSIEVQE